MNIISVIKYHQIRKKAGLLLSENIQRDLLFMILT
ncbi:hypothetical protein BSNT_07578 [Bacillus subtilis subsp. natto BEST195]|nr:hypothetical protein BSNT_07578 [Bacillus subtilis subsp. natto BEST195]